MRKLLFFALVLCAFRAHAATCPISSGASSATIVSTITGCASGNTATFAAGTYTLSSTVNVPCGVSITGPAVSIASYTGGDGRLRMGYAPTAIINASVYPVFNYGSCSTAALFEYLEVANNRPSNGGQIIYATSAGNVNNFTISYNYFHGNNWQADAEVPYGSGAQNSILVLFDGNGTPDTNVTVSWNRFGANGDCAGVITDVSYSGFPDSGGSGDGGFCTGVAWHGSMANLNITNNFIYWQEQGIKGFEGAGSGPNYTCAGCIIGYNDISYFHRMGIETQMQGVVTTPATPTSNMTFEYNSIHDPYYAGNGTFAISSNNACPCTNSNPTVGTSISSDIGNVLIENTANTPPSPFLGDGIEFWSQNTSSVSNYNLIQGQWSNSTTIGVDGAMSASGNLTQSSYGAGGANNPSLCYAGANPGYGWWGEERSPPNTPGGSGNTCNFYDGTVQTSASPSLSPGTTGFTSSQIVTFNCSSCTNRDTNTTIWYTTDGSTPVPATGTARYTTVGGTITLTSTTTVKAVGMWGAPNQPTTYPTGPQLAGSGANGYGYQPSSAVSATYTKTGSNPPPTGSTIIVVGP